MKFCDTFLRIFTIFVVIFTTLTISLPIDKRINLKAIVVTAPGPEPKFIGTKQTTTWYCVLCNRKENVKIEVIKNGHEVVHTINGEKAGSGSAVFDLDPSWAHVGNAYNVKVSLEKDPNVFGISVKPFPVLPSQEDVLSKIPKNIPINLPHF
uniref:Uncharacterized protein n=1 Tax=Anthurium amnicola TaxID=1678845 RepID=A0A1D1ZEA5_9ARAE